MTATRPGSFDTPGTRILVRRQKKRAPRPGSSYRRRMLDLTRITELAQDVAVQVLGRDMVGGIHVEPKSDWTGQDALDVEVRVSRSSQPLPIDGEMHGTMILRLGDRLEALGEPRFAFIRYSFTEGDAPLGDPEP